MTKEDLKMLNNIDKIKERIINSEDLRPFLKDRTLLYGYTGDRKTFHVYLKNMEIHAVVYGVNYNNFNNGKGSPENMKERKIKYNEDYVLCKRLYPECCDYHFCKLLKNRGIELPFTSFEGDRPVEDFYGFIME